MIEILVGDEAGITGASGVESVNSYHLSWGPVFFTLPIVLC